MKSTKKLRRISSIYLRKVFSTRFAAIFKEEKSLNAFLLNGRSRSQAGLRAACGPHIDIWASPVQTTEVIKQR
jgi:hypothetical protein